MTYVPAAPNASPGESGQRGPFPCRDRQPRHRNRRISITPDLDLERLCQLAECYFPFAFSLDIHFLFIIKRFIINRECPRAIRFAWARALTAEGVRPRSSAISDGEALEMTSCRSRSSSAEVHALELFTRLVAISPVMLVSGPSTPQACLFRPLAAPSQQWACRHASHAIQVAAFARREPEPRVQERTQRLVRP
jgi:hypothetical protein